MITAGKYQARRGIVFGLNTTGGPAITRSSYHDGYGGDGKIIPKRMATRDEKGIKKIKRPKDFFLESRKNALGWILKKETSNQMDRKDKHEKALVFLSRLIDEI